MASASIKYCALRKTRRNEMWNNIIFEKILIFMFPFLEAVFLLSMIKAMRTDKKILKIISYGAITCMYFSICILLWVNRNT